MTDRPWTAKWKKVRKLKSGGQGHADIVVPADGTPGTFVLKTLREPLSKSSRGRMFREAAALATLEHPGIVTLVEHNTGDWKDHRTELYLVLEYIEGPTLGDYIRDHTRMSLDDALAMTSALLDSVEACHDAGLGHRDIKDNNILLRGGDPRRPVLIDFGLTFSVVEDDSLTGTDEQLGNRFLLLPDLKVGGKRDLRSDVTLAAACLFYAATGMKPVVLRDGQNLPPHERADAKPVLATFSSEIRPELSRFFGKTFRPHAENRWQSAAEARDAVDAIIAPRPATSSLSSVALIKAAAHGARKRSEDAGLVREEAASLVADVLAEILDPQLSLIIEGLESRRREGLLVAVREAIVSTRDFIRNASKDPGPSSTKIFDFSSAEPSVKSFNVNMELVLFPRGSGLPGEPLPPSPAELPVEIHLEFHYPGRRSERLLYFCDAGGRLLLAPGGPVDPNHISRQVFDWVDAPYNWEEPL